ncbi:MAG: YraN family protein [Alphaproteobacteria bacterium]|nr:YraN family protein [Alphaproteobacteria bacterium]
MRLLPLPHVFRSKRPAGARQRSERMGRRAEWIAAGLLLSRGYWIIGRRVRTPYGEIDLIARRGRRLAFVEVKYRDTAEAADLSVSAAQAARIAAAAEYWAWKRPAYRCHQFGLDVIYITPWRLPRYRIDGLQ